MWVAIIDVAGSPGTHRTKDHHMSKHQAAALLYAENYKLDEGDSMAPEKRRAWIAAIEYARSMGVDDNSQKVDFAIHCDGRTDLDNAWDEYGDAQVIRLDGNRRRGW